HSGLDDCNCFHQFALDSLGQRLGFTSSSMSSGQVLSHWRKSAASTLDSFSNRLFSITCSFVSAPTTRIASEEIWRAYLKAKRFWSTPFAAQNRSNAFTAS